MAERARITLFVYITKPRIIRTTVHVLSVNRGFVLGNSGRDRPAIDRDTLRDRILALKINLGKMMIDEIQRGEGLG
jgi:hypothetical protein